MIGTHGSLVAASNTTAHKKCAPTVQVNITNFVTK